jgi:hypothetical protein
MLRQISHIQRVGYSCKLEQCRQTTICSKKRVNLSSSYTYHSEQSPPHYEPKRAEVWCYKLSELRCAAYSPSLTKRGKRIYCVMGISSNEALRSRSHSDRNCIRDSVHCFFRNAVLLDEVNPVRLICQKVGADMSIGPKIRAGLS